MERSKNGSSLGLDSMMEPPIGRGIISWETPQVRETDQAQSNLLWTCDTFKSRNRICIHKIMFAKFLIYLPIPLYLVFKHPVVLDTYKSHDTLLSEVPSKVCRVRVCS